MASCGAALRDGDEIGLLFQATRPLVNGWRPSGSLAFTLNGRRLGPPAFALPPLPPQAGSCFRFYLRLDGRRGDVRVQSARRVPLTLGGHGRPKV